MGWEGLLGAAYIRNISFEKTILVFVLVSSCVGKDKDKEFVLKGLSNIATQNNTAKHHTYIYGTLYTIITQAKYYQRKNKFVFYSYHSD